MTEEAVTLPPLPETVLRFEIGMTKMGERLDYTANQMREYARAAILAEREAWRGEVESCLRAAGLTAEVARLTAVSIRKGE